MEAGETMKTMICDRCGKVIRRDLINLLSSRQLKVPDRFDHWDLCCDCFCEFLEFVHERPKEEKE